MLFQKRNFRFKKIKLKIKRTKLRGQHYDYPFFPVFFHGLHFPGRFWRRLQFFRQFYSYNVWGLDVRKSNGSARISYRSEKRSFKSSEEPKTAGLITTINSFCFCSWLFSDSSSSEHIFFQFHELIFFLLNINNKSYQDKLDSQASTTGFHLFWIAVIRF